MANLVSRGYLVAASPNVMKACGSHCSPPQSQDIAAFDCQASGAGFEEDRHFLLTQCVSAGFTKPHMLLRDLRDRPGFLSGRTLGALAHVGQTHVCCSCLRTHILSCTIVCFTRGSSHYEWTRGVSLSRRSIFWRPHRFFSGVFLPRLTILLILDLRI